MDNVWAWADPVHLAPALYAEAANGILEVMAQAEAEPARKRPRLESVAPAVISKPRGKVSLPGWVMGRGPSAGKFAGQAVRGGGRGWPSVRARDGFRGRGRFRSGRY